jgi:hypothetical protein
MKSHKNQKNQKICGSKPTNDQIPYKYVINWKDLNNEDQWEILKDLNEIKFFLVVLTQHGIKSKNIYVGKVANVRKIKQLAEFYK